ncbi:hypothetical protein [Nonomuraea bangladeshensis]|uniref:hypothetical protein n=1 Tax=Nonomuraea bangladeshensis TaxID=404385 RepID=UPI003C2EE2A4
MPFIEPGLSLNHNETVLRDDRPQDDATPGLIMNHNETVVTDTPGLSLNHNETVLA